MVDDARRTDPVILYDGLCVLCNTLVQAALKRDARGSLRLAALQSDYGQAVVTRHPELKAVDSVVWLAVSANGEEKVFTRSDAALQLVAYLGGVWSLLLMAYAVPRPIRDLCYDLFARHRARLFGRYNRCPLPSPATRARFVDTPREEIRP